MSKTRIATSWIVAYAAAVAALVGVAVVAAFGVQAARDQIEIAGQSLRQLETARILEASFNRFLLDLSRRPAGAENDFASPSAGNLRGTLLVHRGIISEEIAAARNAEERDAERKEMVRALRLTTVFEDIERKAIFARAQNADSGQPVSARLVADLIAPDELVFREILTRIIQDERDEVASAIQGLDELRRRYLVLGSAVVVGSLLVALAFGVAAYGRILRPIRALTQAVEGFPGSVSVRAPNSLPGEFSLLADRYNQMLGRIESEQERLKEEVAERTADLAKANRDLMRIDEARRAFFANISHELRTPVTVLLGEAQIALRSEGDERAALERISANGGFLRRRLDDLLSLARSDDGTLSLERAPFQLADAVESAVASVRAFASVNEVALDFQKQGDRALVGDASALRQAVLALVDNAIKFSPPDGEIAVLVDSHGVSVSDQGPGFGEEDPMEMFDRYVQGGGGKLRGGTGLGLAIVRWIADHHGASIKAKSREEGGAEVRIEWE